MWSNTQVTEKIIFQLLPNFLHSQVSFTSSSLCDERLLDEVISMIPLIDRCVPFRAPSRWLWSVRFSKPVLFCIEEKSRRNEWVKSSKVSREMWMCCDCECYKQKSDTQDKEEACEDMNCSNFAIALIKLWSAIQFVCGSCCKSICKKCWHCRLKF
jgi:hypothetical protein